MQSRGSEASPLVVHITTVHPPFDVRIFGREARTLAQNGYNVVLLAPHASDVTVDGVRVVPVLRPNHRLGRMLFGAARAYRQARRMPASLYHIHDPELLFAGWLLARSGRAVIYDAHEDTPAQILDKEWIPKPLRRIVAWAFDKAERHAARRLAGVVTATEKIAERFPGATVVHNYPDLERFPAPVDRVPSDAIRAVYVGGLTRTRGATQMVEALGALHSENATLELIGAIDPPALAQELGTLPGYARVRAHGQKPWDESWRFVRQVGDIGLLLYQPAKNHVEALPNKLFEYMAAGLPIVASDFPLWRRIVEQSGAGLVVDPKDPTAIAAAVDRLARDPELRRAMGDQAQTAAAERYNWAKESEKLLEMYRKVLHAHR